jgi:putative restriction endonuclease
MQHRRPTAFVAITDRDWLEHIRSLPARDEVNFWQPNPHGFQALRPGEMFLFKLHAKDGGRIVGMATFLRYAIVPVSIAWQAFGQKNGARSLLEMRERIQRYRVEPNPFRDYDVGCIMLSSPLFFSEEASFEAPGWKPNLQAGRTYFLDEEPGLTLARMVQRALAVGSSAEPPLVAEGDRYGLPVLFRPRLGQGSFQAAVLDAYSRRCAITGEKVIPALEAAHIVPYSDGGEHRVDNGLLLRRDVHALFDRGYITVTPDLKVRVSRRLKDEFDNGREYLTLNGSPLQILPRSSRDRPNQEFLIWHNRHRFEQGVA